MKLTHEIISHILSNFGINSKKMSIISNTYKTASSIKFQEAEDKEIIRPVYSISSTIENKEIKVYMVDISLEAEEYCFIISVKDLPVYGLYYYLDGDFEKSMIAASVEPNIWLECNVFLQATFLAGMENVKDLHLSWKKYEINKEDYDLLYSFIEYYNLHE